ncbi:MAG: Re/Si-specific NAD(P)(+) transhydrogenase subunit alpha [Planctomycetes bacterium]|nr:Re/Si-specific NAD(P)(+) transhydrogenase subunit alpha [Planctomycetota bacterium]
MKAAVLKERFPDERRVALLPENVQKLQAAGYEILIERGAGLGASITDEDYSAAGAKLIDRAEAATADILLQVRSAGANTVNGDDDVQLMHAGQIVIGMCDPLGNAESIDRLADYGVSQVALEMIPRISRAQSMDVLSSMATIAGYRAVLHAAYELPRMFPLNMTAAGTLKAAKVFIIGAGVAGLQAAATAKRLGAVVSAYDVRPDCREQVESIGARFVEVQLELDDAEDEGGYAKQQSEEFLSKQRELMAELAAESDVVITTAAIPGRQSPLLILADAVAAMKPGSVIVDLAAERGGNCELTQADETVVAHNVTILGPTNLPSEIPNHASQMFGNNITKFLLHLVDGDGQVSLDLEDEIIQGCLVSYNGEVVNVRIASMLGVEIKETTPSDTEPSTTAIDDLSSELSLDDEDEATADELGLDDEDEATADELSLDDEDEAKTDELSLDDEDEATADELSLDDEGEAESDSTGGPETDDYSDDDFDADIDLAFEDIAKVDSSEMDFDKDHVAEDDLGADEEETQDYDFYKDSQNE